MINLVKTNKHQNHVKNKCSGKVNKTRYDDPGKPMKQTNFTVKNLRENLLKKQFTIVQNFCP